MVLEECKDVSVYMTPTEPAGEKFHGKVYWAF